MISCCKPIDIKREFSLNAAINILYTVVFNMFKRLGFVVKCFARPTKCYENKEFYY